jgi:hypothetical protein
MPVLLLLFIVLIVWILLAQKKKKKAKSKQYAEFELKGLTKLGESGKFVGGHPEINRQYAFTELMIQGEEISIWYKATKIDKIYPAAMIFKNSIKGITVIDKSTMQSRVSTGALLLVGVWALAMPKKSKTIENFLSIQWNDGKFDHETVFSFEGPNSALEANTLKNTLFKVLR